MKLLSVQAIFIYSIVFEVRADRICGRFRRRVSELMIFRGWQAPGIYADAAVRAVSAGVRDAFASKVFRGGFVMQKWTEKEKFIQMNKEAKATWIVGFIIMIFWFVTGFGIYAVAPDWQICYMPAWMVISCIGSWILSIVGVVYLVKCVFKDFDLNEEDWGGNK